MAGVCDTGCYGRDDCFADGELSIDPGGVDEASGYVAIGVKM